MRTVELDFTKELSYSIGIIGYVGEHNETELLITPPSELSEDAAVAAYRVAFGVNGEIFHSASIPAAETFTCLMWGDTTKDNAVTIQLEATDTNGELIAKSQSVVGVLAPSVQGVETENQFTQPILNEIAANTAARHTHNNKDILDAITAPPAVEISTTATASKYTPDELRALVNIGTQLTYQSEPIIHHYGGAVNFNFIVLTQTAIGTPKMIYKKVNNLKVISNDTSTLSTGEVFIPLSVNNVAFTATNAIEIKAENIEATSGWTPSADTDLATKKYVDDNTGGSPDWSDIQNKPNFATVATSGDYDDLLNKPSIPAAQVQSDWNEADNTKVEYIKNKPTIPAAQIQSDWSQADNTKLDYIKNKPSLATVATSGSYNDLLNQPTIPDISGCEVTTNKVTAIDNTSTDTQYPSAKCVYDLIGDVEQILADLIGGA